MTDIPLGHEGRLCVAEVIVADTETTGLSPFGLRDDGAPTGDPDGPDRLCAAAAYLLRHDGAAWRIADSRTWLVDPGRPVPEGAARVNGFAREDDWARVPEGRFNLALQPGFAEIAGELLAFVGPRPLVFHNAVFDTGVLDAELARAGRAPLDQPVLCTKKAFADLLGLGRPDHYVSGTNLNRLCDTLGVDRSQRVGADGKELHGAAVDALLTAHCFARLEPLGWLRLEAAADQPHRRAGRLAALTPPPAAAPASRA